VMTFEFPSMRDGYAELVKYVSGGFVVNVRGHLTYEQRNVMIAITERPWDALPLAQGRNVSTAIAAAEFLQLVAGVQMPELMVKLSPFFREILDGEAFHGGYGQRTREALPLVVDLLRRDPYTRQAQVSLWDNFRDLHTPAARDLPCTSSLQFFIRDGRLDLDVTMRSNDIWLGVPYDFFIFGHLLHTVANVLDVPVGTYTHHARSLHLYDRDLEATTKLHPQEMQYNLPAGIGDPGMSWDIVVQIARSYLEGKCEKEDWWTRTLSVR